MKIVKKNQLKIVIFTAVKNRCMLHGHVFLMKSLEPECPSHTKSSRFLVLYVLCLFWFYVCLCIQRTNCIYSRQFKAMNRLCNCLPF